MMKIKNRPSEISDHGGFISQHDQYSAFYSPSEKLPYHCKISVLYTPWIHSVSTFRQDFSNKPPSPRPQLRLNPISSQPLRSGLPIRGKKGTGKMGTNLFILKQSRISGRLRCRRQGIFHNRRRWTVGCFRCRSRYMAATHSPCCSGMPRRQNMPLSARS